MEKQKFWNSKESDLKQFIERRLTAICNKQVKVSQLQIYENKQEGFFAVQLYNYCVTGTLFYKVLDFVKEFASSFGFTIAPRLDCGDSVYLRLTIYFYK